MAGRYVGFGKKLFDLARGKGKSNVSTTIVGVDVAKNLATKRKIQDNVTEAVDSAFKKADLPPSVRDSIETKNKKAALKRDEGKKLKGLSYKLDKLEEKVKSRLKILKQRTKGSQARLDQNLFETEQASKKRKEFEKGTPFKKNI